MKLIHQSEKEITEVYDGDHGKSLWFSRADKADDPNGLYEYMIEIPDTQIITATGLFYHKDAAEKLSGIVMSVSKSIGINDLVTVKDLISQHRSLDSVMNNQDDSEYDSEDISRFNGYEILLQTAAIQCAIALGYDAVELRSLTFDYYINFLVNMEGKKLELKQPDNI